MSTTPSSSWVGGTRRNDDRAKQPLTSAFVLPLSLAIAQRSQRAKTVRLTSENQGWHDSSATLVEKYGKCQEVVGRGKFGIVFVSCKKKDDGAGEELYAVKKFRRQPKETERTLDLLEDEKGNYCEVMEFCSGGDLHNLMMRGVEYIHEMGVAHLDLNPRNLLLTGHGLLKISGFGRSECVRLAWENDVHMVSGIRGSGPYIAPEEYTDEEFDGHAVDIW
ncbi:hypothetical protein FOXYS1_14123, partial [Fusarium oxysporum]